MSEPSPCIRVYPSLFDTRFFLPIPLISKVLSLTSWWGIRIQAMTTIFIAPVGTNGKQLRTQKSWEITMQVRLRIKQTVLNFKLGRHNNYLQFHHHLGQSLLAMLHLLPQRTVFLLFELARFDLLQLIELAQILVSLETQIEDSQVPTKSCHQNRCKLTLSLPFCQCLNLYSLCLN